MATADGRNDRRTLALATATFAAGAVLARRPEVRRVEHRCFRTVIDLPTVLHPPAWAVMQLGSLGGVFGAAAVVDRLAGRRAAGWVAAWGTATWVGAKGLKRTANRGRPHESLGGRVRGRAQSGLGYPSGHAAVAAAVASVAAPYVPAPWRRPLWAAALVAGPTRVYVGAHLPLDIAGGWALGLGAGAAARLTGRGPRRSRS